MLRIWRDFLSGGGYLILVPAGFFSHSRAILIACLVAALLSALVAWLLALRRLRAIRDTPTSRIASAAQGYVELIGKGRPLPGQEVLSPAHSLPCLWYRYRRFKLSNDKWRQIESGESDSPFILDDGAGRCQIDPDGAEILTDRQESYRDGDYRLEEELLLIDAPIYAQGEFGSQGQLDPRAEQGKVLEEWKQDWDTLHRRFDLDGNDEIDSQEWQLAQTAAQREVAARQDAALASYVLTRPRSGRPFLIASFPPQQLTNRYRLRAWLHFGFSLASLLVLAQIP